MYLAGPEVVAYIRNALAFPGVQQAGVLEKRFSNGAREVWYLLTSLSAEQLGADEFLAVIRKHWQIENGLHHVKDRTLAEDAYQGRSVPLVQNLTVLRNAVVSIYNRLIPPGQRTLSRPLQAIQIATRPRQCLHDLQAL